MTLEEIKAQALFDIDGALLMGRQVPSHIMIFTRGYPPLRLEFKSSDGGIERIKKNLIVLGIRGARKEDKFEGAAMIGEAWFSHTTPGPIQDAMLKGIIRPVADPDRKEVVLLSIWTGTEKFFRTYDIDRSGKKPKRGAETTWSAEEGGRHESWMDEAFK